MKGIFKFGPIAAATVAIATIGAWTKPATAQMWGGIGRYGLYDRFSENWYDPYDWYGGGPGADAYAESPGAPGNLYEGAEAMGEAGEEDFEAPPSRPVPYAGSPYFQRGYSPYYNYRDIDDDFYDDDYYAGYGIESSDEGEGEGEGAALPGDAGAVRARSRAGIEESDELYEDYDSLYGGYGDAEYVEEGYQPTPTTGIGPRYRGYYSRDWFDNGADFDDWYDNPQGFAEEGIDAIGEGEGEGELEDLGDAAEAPEIEGAEEAADVENIGVVPEP